MTFALLNPGTGCVGGRCTMASAWRNLEALMERDGVEGEITSDPDAENEGGRFLLVLKIKGRRPILVDMPGCSLARLKNETMDQPRMYVDGSSWFWQFADLKERE